MPNGAQIGQAVEMFKEALPPQCPPGDALVSDHRVVLRLISSRDITEESFYSHARLGKPLPPKMCPCRWASCSTYIDDGKSHRTKGVTKLPKLRGMKYIAVLQLVPDAGRIKDGERGHVDLWMYRDFDPVNNVIEIREVGS